jgi:hypothetical protein
MSLHELQDRFFRQLRGERVAQGDVRSTADLSADERMQIYTNAYGLRLVGALREDAPMLRALLGDTEFDELARSYIAAHPSTTRNLRWYGEAFPGWLSESPATSPLPLLAELAEWERLLRRAFDSEDAPVLRLEDLQNLAPDAWPDLRLVRVPSAALHRQRFNTTAIWQALKAETPPPPQQVLSETLTWLVWRCELQTLFRSVTANEQTLLVAIDSGITFAELCETLAEHTEEDVPEEDIAAQAIGWLKRWVEDGLLQISYRSIEPFN